MEETTTRSQPNMQIWAWISFFCGFVFLLFSIIAGIRIPNTIDADARKNLLTRVQATAYLINPSDIQALASDTTDLQRPEYQHLKQEMFDLRKINSDARFLYIMRSNGSKLYFTVDSEQTTSADYSPPGQIYDDTSPLEFNNYINNVSFTEGPYTDKWGSWVSGYAPIHDDSGKVLAVFGMDINTASWQYQIHLVQISIIIIGLLGLGIFLILGMYLMKASVFLKFVKDLNAKLALKTQSLNKIIKDAHLGEWSIIPRTSQMLFDDEMYKLTGIKTGIQMTGELFENVMDAESRKVFKEILEKSFSKREEKLSCNINIIQPDNTKNNIKLNATVSYSPDGTPILIRGTAQNMN